MILSTFVVFNIEELERIDRLINDLDVHEFFSSNLWPLDINDGQNYCLVGFNDLVKNISELQEADILNNFLSDKLHWVFSYNEDKNFYRKTISNYINDKVNNYILSFKYVIIDYFFTEELEANTVSNLLSYYIPQNNISKSLTINKSIYFLLENDNTIYNISLKMIKYYNDTEGVQQILNYFNNTSKNQVHDVHNLLVEKYRDIIDRNVVDDVLLERYLIILI